MQLDQDEVASYAQRAFFEKKETTALSPATIFFSVLGAILVSWVVREAYIEWQVQRALIVFNQQIQIMNAQSQQELQHFQLQSEAARAAAQERVRIEMEAKEQQRLAAAQLDNDKRKQALAVIQEKEAKEVAWKKFYSPIRGCESENPNRDAIKCGNDYIKARRRFELAWIYIR